MNAPASQPVPRGSIPLLERPVGLVRGTQDYLAADCSRLAALERQLLEGFARAGYEPVRTPILEFAELHERKSGAGIVSKLFELTGGGPAAICLRPELTASIVRAYAEAPFCPPLPWRVSSSGPVFRYESDPSGHRLREFTQVGVELIGAGGSAADAEVIGLANRSLQEAGIPDAFVRIGHVGLILEILGGTGLPPAATSALVEMLSASAAEGKGIQDLESALDRLAGWLKAGDDAEAIVPAVSRADDRGVDRLFRHLVPDVTGRRSGHEIIHRLRRKWDLARSLDQILGRVRQQVHALAELRGPTDIVLAQLARSFAALAPRSVSGLGELVAHLGAHGVESSRVELDLGFGRGIGFYTQMIFELVVPTPAGPIEVCGGGRYDGLARVLGSDRDARGVGFAFGLERLVDVTSNAA
ncbi:MAG: ATP phosphoribosyltransferase regulatory subunit [Isosphaeraceae bacterium]